MMILNAVSLLTGVAMQVAIPAQHNAPAAHETRTEWVCGPWRDSNAGGKVRECKDVEVSK